MGGMESETFSLVRKKKKKTSTSRILTKFIGTNKGWRKGGETGEP